jgi:hypothetical protein
MDTFAGDQVLKATALLIQHAVRQTDIVARYGGKSSQPFSSMQERRRRGRLAEGAEKCGGYALSQ